ncbi:hypothetical protein ACWEKM_22135 [Streptomyces sp. NPDC004752]
MAHGYGKHTGRHEGRVGVLTGHGAAVYGPDHLGHGRSARRVRARGLGPASRTGVRSSGRTPPRAARLRRPPPPPRGPPPPPPPQGGPVGTRGPGARPAPPRLGDPLGLLGAEDRPPRAAARCPNSRDIPDHRAAECRRTTAQADDRV